ncbi:MAG: DegQ family serine endoprotease [Gammaproteobacteria bacterium]
MSQVNLIRSSSSNRVFNWKAVLLTLTIFLMIQPFLEARSLPEFTKLAKENSPAVVNISTTQKRTEMPDLQIPQIPQMPDIPEDSPLNDFFRHFFGEGNGPGRSQPTSSLGSGFIIAEDGYVITNHHVVHGADEIIVRLNDRREFVAKLIGSDKQTDIAVLKLEAKGLPVVNIGRSKELEVGEWVLAIGSPFGFDYSVTAGIVSAKGRSLPNENYIPFIQTDVAINPGNSGGPLFNLDGDAVGVNSQIYSRTGGFMGLSFAIPMDIVMNVYQQLRDKGSVSRGWLGVMIQDVTRELAESFGMSKPGGALIAKVLDASPAAKAGIKAGDIITEFNGRAIDMSSELPPIVGLTPTGERVPVKVLRAGKQLTLKVLINELPGDKKVAAAPARDNKPLADNRLNIRVKNLTNEQRDQMGLENQGVLVEAVNKGPAQEAGVNVGDVILLIDNKKITNGKMLKGLIDKLPSNKAVPVLIQRDGNPMFLAVKIPK